MRGIEMKNIKVKVTAEEYAAYQKAMEVIKRIKEEVVTAYLCVDEEEKKNLRDTKEFANDAFYTTKKLSSLLICEETNTIEDITKEDIIAWIAEHDVLAEDFEMHFGVSIIEE